MALGGIYAGTKERTLMRLRSTFSLPNERPNEPEISAHSLADTYARIVRISPVMGSSRQRECGRSQDAFVIIDCYLKTIFFVGRNDSRSSWTDEKETRALCSSSIESGRLSGGPGDEFSHHLCSGLKSPGFDRGFDDRCGPIYRSFQAGL